MKKKAFIYVGHSNWGKSYALKIITNNNSRVKHTVINGYRLFVRKMSNDDYSIGLLDFVKTISSMWQENFILAFCPNQSNDQEAMNILNELIKSCDLYFFVQEEKYNNSLEKITPAQMAHLYSIGTVQVLSNQNADTVRAQEFKTFIQQYI